MSAPEPAAETRLVLIRHGESQATVRRVVAGIRTCSGLSPRGWEQVESLARRLDATREIDAGALYTSAYPRAVETADRLRDALGAEVRVEDGFGEHDPGPECDGLTFDEFVDRFGMPDWEGEPFGTTFPGGETLASFQHRVGATLHDVLGRHLGSTVVVVCHGGVIDTILRSALWTAPSGLFELHTANASLTELVRPRPGRWRLVRYNDAAHLADVTP